MTFTDIPDGTAVFVDANTFVYYFEPHAVFGPACADLLTRIENKELEGFSSSHVLSDVSHRLMTLEVMKVLGRPAAGLANWLKRHPTEVQRLNRYKQALDEISLFGIDVLPVTGRLVSLAADVSRQFGLLTDDAVVVAVMRDTGLSHLASNDYDFDRVPGLTRYSPV